MAATNQDRNGGHSRVTVEEGHEKEYSSLAFEPVASQAIAQGSATLRDAGELFEEFFQVKMNVGKLSELHHPYTSV